MKFVSELVCATALAMAIFGGSETVAAQEKKPAKVKFRAICFDPRDSPPPQLHVGALGSRKPLEIEKTRISGIQTAPLRDGQFVDFFTTEEQELPAATLTLPASGMEHLLFVFFATREGPPKAVAIALPPASFKSGSTLLINTTSAELGFRHAGGKTVVIAPGSSRVLAPPAGVREPMVPIQLFEKPKGDNQWNIAQSTRWPVDHRLRSYVFLYRSPANNQLTLHGVSERMTP